jgi:hypothetical protein
LPLFAQLPGHRHHEYHSADGSLSENLPEYDGRPAHGTVLGPHAIGKVGPRDREVGKVMRWR